MDSRGASDLREDPRSAIFVGPTDMFWSSIEVHLSTFEEAQKLRGKWPYSFISWTNKRFLKAWKFCINNVNGACTTYEKFLIKRRHQWFCYAILPYKYFWLKYLCLSHVLLNFLSVKTSESIILLICSMQCSYSKLFS